MKALLNDIIFMKLQRNLIKLSFLLNPNKFKFKNFKKLKILLNVIKYNQY